MRYDRPNKTYYVDATNGSDSNNGISETSAWQTITKVNAQTFRPGDRILFKRGETWSGTSLIAPSSGNPYHYIFFGAYGSGINPIINKAADYGVRSNGKNYLIFDSINGTSGNRNYYIFDSHHIIVQNNQLRATTLEESSININCTSDGLSHHILIDNCYISGTPGWGISAGDFQVDFLHIRNCSIINIGNTSGTVQHHGIYTTTAKNLLVEGCIIENPLNAGIVLKAYSPNTCSGIIRRNTINKAGQGTGSVEVGIGISIDGAEWAIIENNRITNGSSVAPAAGIRISKNASLIPSSNVQIYNNTIVRNYVGIGLSDGDTGFIIKNNLIMQDFAYIAANSRVPLKLETSNEITTNTFDNNSYYFKNGAGVKDPIDVAGSQMTLAAWKALTGSPDPNSISSNPLLVTEYTDLHLQAGSPARNIGANIGENSRSDVEGVPLDSTPNAGCYQT